MLELDGLIQQHLYKTSKKEKKGGRFTFWRKPEKSRDRKMDIADQDVRSQIVHDFTHNILVEAGAGTGKTTLLVERTVEAIVKQGVSLERMALITFLENAAEEIKIRVRDRLEEVAATPGIDRHSKTRALSALHQLPGASITTIHGFSLRILEALSHHAPVPLGFRVMDTYQSEKLFDESFYQWIDTDSISAKRIEELLNYGVSFERFREMAQFLSTCPDVPTYQAPRPDVTFIDAFVSSADELADIASRYARATDQGLIQIREIARYLRNLNLLDSQQRVKSLGTWHLPSAKGNKKNWSAKDRLTEQKVFINLLKEQVDQFKVGLADYMLQEILGLIVDRFLPYWKEQRWRRASLTFDDLLWETRDFLRNHDSVNSYDLIMVDEFQDTDELQAEIIVRMLTNSRGRDWRTAVIPQGRLFVVGDPKQSIYRFRGANVTIYQFMRQKIAQEGGLTLSIVQNFRTPREILDPVNQLFQRHWPPSFDPSTPYVAPYTPLTPFFSAPGESRLIVKGGLMEDNIYGRRTFEARQIVRLLKKMVIDHPIRIRDGQDTRLVRLGDVALVVPARSGLYIYQQMLEKGGIAVAPEGGIRFFERDVIRGFQQFFSALRNPSQISNTVGWLLSPWVGFSHEDLARHKSLGGTWNYLLRTEDKGWNKLIQVRDKLEEWHRKWWVWRAEDFFWELYDWSALPSVLAERGDVANLSNLAKMADLCRDLGDEWGNDEFCRWLEGKVYNQEQEEEGPLPQDQDAVHVVTVHKSKGLEWPLVVVANWNVGSVGKHSGMRIESGRIALAQGNLRSRLWDDLTCEDRMKAQAESERLYYVALTRARDYLIVMDTFSKDDNGPSAAWSLYRLNLVP